MHISKNNKVLIYRLGSLGDTIMALPSFHKIKNSFADADITLLTNKPVMAKAAAIEAILGSDYFFNRAINYPVGTRNLKVLIDLIKQIRSLKIDTVVNINPTRSRRSLFRDKLFFMFAGVNNLIGFDTAKENLEVCTDPQTGIMEWEAKRLAKRINQLGVVDLVDDQSWDLKLSEEEIEIADSFDDILGKDIPVLAISTGTKNQSNDWEIDNWKKLLNQLSDLLPNWTLLVIGAPDETAVAVQLITSWKHQSINLCGKTSPRISAALLKKANIFIGHDSGPIHLAASMGTPVVGIYSARNLPGQWFPRGQNNQILYKVPACAGCGLEVCVAQQKKCILSITVAEVVESVIKILNTDTTIASRILQSAIQI